MNVPVYNAFKLSDSITAVENIPMPYIKSLYSCLNRVKGDGYTGSFEPTDDGLQEIKTGRVYMPDQFKITNFFRFEGNSSPGDNVIMYIIEANDGVKGTYINSKPTALSQPRFENLLATD